MNKNFFKQLPNNIKLDEEKVFQKWDDFGMLDGIETKNDKQCIANNYELAALLLKDIPDDIFDFFKCSTKINVSIFPLIRHVLLQKPNVYTPFTKKIDRKDFNVVELLLHLSFNYNEAENLFVENYSKEGYDVEAESLELIAQYFPYFREGKTFKEFFEEIYKPYLESVLRRRESFLKVIERLEAMQYDEVLSILKKGFDFSDDFEKYVFFYLKPIDADNKKLVSIDVTPFKDKIFDMDFIKYELLNILKNNE